MEFTNENGFLFFATIRPMINGWSFKCTKNMLRSTAEKYVAYVCRCRYRISITYFEGKGDLISEGIFTLVHPPQNYAKSLPLKF